MEVRYEPFTPKHRKILFKPSQYYLAGNFSNGTLD